MVLLLCFFLLTYREANNRAFEMNSQVWYLDLSSSCFRSLICKVEMKVVTLTGLLERSYIWYVLVTFKLSWKYVLVCLFYDINSWGIDTSDTEFWNEDIKVKIYLKVTEVWQSWHLNLDLHQQDGLHHFAWDCIISLILREKCYYYFLHSLCKIIHVLFLVWTFFF